MEFCEIEIFTSTDGTEELFRTKGRLCRVGERVEVCYSHEGDFVTLRVRDSAFEMERRGETNLSCVFRAGERTAMRVSGFGGSGEISVETRDYSFQTSDKDCFIRLNYDLIFSDHLQTFQLELKIKTSEEK